MQSRVSRTIAQQWLSLSVPFLTLRHPTIVAFIHFQYAPGAVFLGVVEEGLILFE